MVNALDVAQYILLKRGPMPGLKLQRLVYYCQAWHLVWQEKRLFPEKIEAWMTGPIIPRLFKVHRKQFKVRAILGGKSRKLNIEQRETVDAVLEYYGDKSSQWLADLTHMEDPWKLACDGIPDNRNLKKISTASMAEYYGGLQPREET